MSADLVGGRYPVTYSLNKFLGLPSNASQANIAARTNADAVGLGDLTDNAASLVSGKLTLVPVPVEVGDPLTYIDVLVGATAAGTPTHSWAALYQGVLTTASLLASQSADGGSTAIPASTRFTFQLGSEYIVKSTDAPYGYLYVAVSETATTVSSLVGANVAAAAQYAWFADTPAFFAGTSGSALGATAPASVTLSGVSAIATVPLVFLR